MALGENRSVRLILTFAALAFLGIFLLVPLIVVFTEAFKKGLWVYFQTFSDQVS